ncbi:MAG: uracil phosphoribosyltransferase [Calditrichia bacterium]
MEFKNLTIVNHPLLQDKLTKMRDVRTPSYEFRRLLKEIAALMTYEICRDFETLEMAVETPMEDTVGRVLKKEITVVPVLRAGLGMIDGILSLVPEVRVGMLGLYRDEETLQPIDYYRKFPENLPETEVILVDPMLATGGSAVAAANSLKKAGVKNLVMMALIAAPEGVQAMLEAHPDVRVFTAALDRQLNEKGYILPGLGDAGDRCFGT